MRNTQSFIERISIVIVASVPVFAILNIILEQRGLIWSTFPFPRNLEVSHALVVTIAVGSIIYWLALLFLRLSAPKNNRRNYRNGILFIGTLVGIPMFCGYSVQALTLPEEITSSLQSGQNHFYASELGQFGDQTINYYFYKCNEMDLECKTIFHTSLGNHGDTPILLGDNKNQQVHFFLKSTYGSNRLFYTYGSQPREYKMEDSEQIDETTFSLYYYERNLDQEFVIIKCEKAMSNSIPCDFLPFRFSSASFEKAELVTDEKAKEIKLLIDEVLIFSYDTTPRCHVEGCIIAEE